MSVYRRMIRTYRFMDKDPIKDKLQTALQDAGLFSRSSLKKLAIIANISYATLDNLFFGDTKRPQNATVEGILGAAGLERVIRAVKGSHVREGNIDVIVEEARAWNKKERARVDRLNAKKARKRRPRKGRPHLRVVGGKAA